MTSIQRKAWKCLEARWDEVGFDRLATYEKETIALFWLEGEVINGGLHQYFANSSGDLCPFAISGLRRLGADATLEILQRAISRLAAHPYPVDRDDRNDALDRLGGESDPFDAETDLLQELPEAFFDMALDDLVLRFELGHPADRRGGR